LSRAIELCHHPQIVIEDEHRSKGYLIFHEKFGPLSNITHDKIYLGVQYIEVLPKKEITKVNFLFPFIKNKFISMKYFFLFIQAVTVQEGDNNLITRLKRACGNDIEIRYEFSEESLKFVRCFTNSEIF